jgi:Tol biopolymer transport system component
VFVRDRRAQLTRRVSVGPAGQQANAWSFEPAISAHGRFVVFRSSASNLVARDAQRNPGAGVFMRDRVAQVTRLVSVGPGGQPANHNSREPAISADGRFVVFESVASNLVCNPTQIPSTGRPGTATTSTTCSCGTGGRS